MECRRYREVDDLYDGGHYEFGREVTYTIWDFECGHTRQGKPKDVGPAPGEPYAPLGRLDGGERVDEWGV